MPSNQTPNYKLSQWEKSDRIQMEDFNADNAKIDAAIKAEADARAAGDAALNTALSKKGNLRVEIYSYVGTGTCGKDNPTFIPFNNGTPFMILIPRNNFQNILLLGTGLTQFPSGYIPVAWNETGVSWYASNDKPGDQLNIKGTRYTAYLFHKLD